MHPAPLRAQLRNHQKLQALPDELLEASIDPDRHRHRVGRRSTTVTNHTREAFTSNPHPPNHPHALGSVTPFEHKASRASLPPTPRTFAWFRARGGLEDVEGDPVGCCCGLEVGPNVVAGDGDRRLQVVSGGEGLDHRR